MTSFGGCDDCGSNQTEIASATVNPLSATVARGGTANTTATYIASPNLRITGYHVQSNVLGIDAAVTATTGSGNNITKTYRITPAATVPIGTHVINLWISVDGARNTVQATRAEFRLTVTQ